MARLYSARLFFRAASALLVAALVVWAGLALADVDLILASLVSANWGYFLSALVLFLVNYLLRALRFSTVLPGSSVSWPFVGAVSIHGGLAYLVPLRLGEFSFPWLVSGFHDQSRMYAMKVLLLARFADLSCLLIVSAGVFAMGLFPLQKFCELTGCYGWIPSLVEKNALQLSFVAALSGVMCILLPHRLLRMTSFLQAAPLLLTGLIWLTVALFYWAIGMSVGIELDPVSLVLLLLLLALGQMLPVQGLASLGAHEFAWAFVLMLLHREIGVAVALSLSTHVLVVFAVWLLLLVGVAARRKRLDKTAEDSRNA